MESSILQQLVDLQQARTPLLQHPKEPRLLLKLEGGGALPAHKFRSFAFVAAHALRAGTDLMRITDRSSGSWAMAGAYVGGRLLGAQTRWVSVGPPPAGVRAYVEAQGGTFDVVKFNQDRIGRLEELRNAGWWTPDQHNNPLVLDAFDQTLGAELEEELVRRGDDLAFVVGAVGTGGMLGGTVRRLRRAGLVFRSLGADLASSLTHPGPRAWRPSYLPVRGVGSHDEVCGVLRLARPLIDETFASSAYDAARHMSACPLPGGCGLSGGLALAVATEFALPRCPHGKKVLVLLADSGLLYTQELAVAHALFPEVPVG